MCDCTNRPLRSATIIINGATQTFPPEIPAPQRKILASLGIPNRGTKQNVLTRVGENKYKTGTTS